jgi:hypothetical protein
MYLDPLYSLQINIQMDSYKAFNLVEGIVMSLIAVVFGFMTGFVVCKRKTGKQNGKVHRAIFGTLSASCLRK